MHISMIYSIYIPRQNTPPFFALFRFYYFASSYAKLILCNAPCNTMITRLTLANLLLAWI